ncbi:hypothetical protein [Petrocella sp. FN5]|uniref:hypothetical protein n=1 Tax=Petrocella sp. FN5 TaxID=3032002 RepID=UPI0023D9DE7C|nr:hypothetical protein [Petrocella sp. FN5]MDF1616443.1 hypothetical protein [Petrocella sp. FN5]
MLKQFIKICILFTVVMALSSFAAYAEPIEADQAAFNTYLSTFNLTEQNIEYGNNRLDTGMTTQALSTVGTLKISNGFSRQAFSTFASDKSIVGQGQSGSVVGLMVYTVNSNQQKVIESYAIKTLGASGMFSETITYAPSRTQYLVIAVKDHQGITRRIFEITTKAMETKVKLENIQIRFVSEDKQVNTSVESMYDWLKSKSNVEF